jgi:hypothetical protein
VPEFSVHRFRVDATNTYQSHKLKSWSSAPPFCGSIFMRPIGTVPARTWESATELIRSSANRTTASLASLQLCGFASKRIRPST